MASRLFIVAMVTTVALSGCITLPPEAEVYKVTVKVTGCSPLAHETVGLSGGTPANGNLNWTYNCQDRSWKCFSGMKLEDVHCREVDAAGMAK